MISPCYNLRATAILENWIDLTLAPKWFFSFKRLVGNWGYPVAGAMKDKKAIMYAKSVKDQAKKYRKQLTLCKKNLDKNKYIIF